MEEDNPQLSAEDQRRVDALFAAIMSGNMRQVELILLKTPERLRRHAVKYAVLPRLQKLVEGHTTPSE